MIGRSRGFFVSRTIEANRNIFNVQSSQLYFSTISINAHNSASAATPLVEHFRSKWPQKKNFPSQSLPDTELQNLTLPETRLVPASSLKFSLSATFSSGSSIFYSHLQYHPADFKVSLKVWEI